MIKEIEQKVLKFIGTNKLIEKGDSILIALSGGPDSVFTLFFFKKFQRKYGIKIGAFHVNHKLRGKESDGDEEYCKKICSKLSVPFASVKINVRRFAAKNKLSIEEAARKLRYDKLQKFASQNNFSKIATAHNLNDNAETVLLNLFSGTGIDGITGIPIKRGNIIRPILSLSKEEILHYLEVNKINYRIDSSNLLDEHKRNFIRNNIVPLIKSKINSSFETALLRSGKVIEENLKLFEQLLQSIIKKYVVIKKDSITIELNILNEINKEAIGLILKRIFTDKLKIEFSFAAYESVLSLLENQTGKKVNLSRGYFALRERTKIVIYKIEEKTDKTWQVKAGQSVKINDSKISLKKVKTFDGKYTSNGKTEFISGDNLEELFILRKWKPGDKFIPLGMKGFKKVSDFLTEQKVSAKEKKDRLVLTNRNNIVWVVGLRIDERYKINSLTKKIMKLWIS